MPRIFRGWLFLLLLGELLHASAAEGVPTADEHMLRQKGIGSDGPTLLRYLQERTPTPERARQIAEWVGQLGSDDFTEREASSRSLVRVGSQAAPALEEASRSRDPEIAQRARRCLDRLHRDQGLSGAVIRLLAERPVPQAVAALLAYLPLAEIEGCDYDLQQSLLHLSARSSKVDPALLVALDDSLALRRGLAAFIVGQSSDAAARASVHRLLRDRDLLVRYQAVQGLLAGRDHQAIPTLIALLEEGPPEIQEDVEDILYSLAGDQGQRITAGEGEQPTRRALRRAWARWWQEQGDQIDLARLDQHTRVLGRTLVPEMHANKVWECGKDGKPIWEVTGLQCPIDAQALPGGRLLVAELSGNRVSERDRQGKILWQHSVTTPIACHRLPNGNTFIGTNYGYFILNRSGTKVVNYQAENGFFIHSIQWQRNGHVVCVSMAGQVLELDGQGHVLRTIALPVQGVPVQGGWSGIESTRNNHYLAVNNGAGRIVEVDRSGATVWQQEVAGACYASRLANGNTLVVSNTAGLLEITSAGKTVWSCPVTTSLWRAHRR